MNAGEPPTSRLRRSGHNAVVARFRSRSQGASEAPYGRCRAAAELSPRGTAAGGTTEGCRGGGSAFATTSGAGGHEIRSRLATLQKRTSEPVSDGPQATGFPWPESTVRERGAGHRGARSVTTKRCVTARPRGAGLSVAGFLARRGSCCAAAAGDCRRAGGSRGQRRPRSQQRGARCPNGPPVA